MQFDRREWRAGEARDGGWLYSLPTHTRQSSGQFLQLSPNCGSHTPLPQLQSSEHENTSSYGSQRPFPQPASTGNE